MITFNLHVNPLAMRGSLYTTSAISLNLLYCLILNTALSYWGIISLSKWSIEGPFVILFETVAVAVLDDDVDDNNKEDEDEEASLYLERGLRWSYGDWQTSKQINQMHKCSILSRDHSK